MRRVEKYMHGTPCWVDPATQVADFDESAGYVMRQGGRLMAKPEKFPGYGRMVVARDPQGADFCIVQPETG